MIVDTISSNTSTTFSSNWGFSVSSATLAGLSVKSSLKDSTKPSAGRGITLWATYKFIPFVIATPV